MNVDLSATPARKPVTNVQVLAVDADHVGHRRPDRVVTEEPLEIRVHGPQEDPHPLAVTMRTPGNDFELAAGFCLTEGVSTEIDTIAYCLGGQGEQLYNVVTVRVAHPIVEQIRDRHFLANSSCGICGKAALDDVEVRCAPIPPGPTVHAAVVAALPDALSEHQRVFGMTGGLHAAARFATDGRVREVREDVGRHNALDKLIGHALLDRALPLHDDILLVSGRLSFELVQKSAVAGIAVLCAVSAPSSLAVAAADRFGQTVVGFVRGGRFNVYTHPDRIDTTS